MSPGEGLVCCTAGDREFALGNALVAFEVDAEITLHRPGAGDQKAAGVACPPFAAGMFDIGGEPVALLDLDVLLWAGAPQL